MTLLRKARETLFCKKLTLTLGRTLAVLCLVVPAFAQYAGPAILSRGEAPAAMSMPQIAFRPFIELNGVYDTGLAGAVTDEQGQVADSSSMGAEVVAGISGTHSWRHTKVGLDYRGSYRNYAHRTYYNGTNQSLLLGVAHKFTRHTTLSLRESIGLYSRDFGLLGMSQTSTYDPSQSYVPTTDYFDNRTFYVSTQADFTIEKSSRLSFNIGGDGFLVRRRSSALYGATGGAARGDVQYRLTRRSTIGLNFNYSHYDYLQVYGASQVHGLAGSYSVRLSRWLELSATVGAIRLETKTVQSVEVDPIITALLGITSATENVYRIRYLPSGTLRLARAFDHGVAYLSGARTVNAGNGLFLTSATYNAALGYNYTGLRRWSFGWQAAYDQSVSYGNIQGRYRSASSGLTVSRQLAHSFHGIVSVSARKYNSPDYSGYNRLIYNARIGIGWTPGDLPLRIW